MRALCCLGFYDDINEGTFGTVKKWIRRPLSNFCFRFKTKIISSAPSSTGYLVEVIPELSDRTRSVKLDPVIMQC